MCSTRTRLQRTFLMVFTLYHLFRWEPYSFCVIQANTCLGIDFSTDNRAFVQAREKTTCVSDAPDFRSILQYCKCDFKQNVLYTCARHMFKVPVRKITLNERCWYGVLKTLLLGVGTVFKRRFQLESTFQYVIFFVINSTPYYRRKLNVYVIQYITFGRFWAMPYWETRLRRTKRTGTHRIGRPYSQFTRRTTRVLQWQR